VNALPGNMMNYFDKWLWWF